MKHFIIWCLLCLATMIPARSQTKEVIVKITGLTCSQCTRSVEMQFKKLKFVSHINMDLQNTSATLTIASEKQTDYNAIAKAVSNSGFSMAGLQAKVNAQTLKKTSNKCYSNNDGKFVLSEEWTPNSNAWVTFDFIGTPFTPQKKTSNTPKSCFKSDYYTVRVLR